MTDAENSTTFSENKDHSTWIAVYSEACLSQKNSGTIDQGLTVFWLSSARAANATRRTKSEREEVSIEQTR
jgi:hypothetical protein